MTRYVSKMTESERKAFVNSLRETLGLGPLYGDRESAVPFAGLIVSGQSGGALAWDEPDLTLDAPPHDFIEIRRSAKERAEERSAVARRREERKEQTLDEVARARAARAKTLHGQGPGFARFPRVHA